MERLGFRRGAAALCALILWTAILTHLSLRWTREQSEVPPAWDHALYLSMGLGFHRSFEEEGALGLARRVLHQATPVAPLFPLTTLPFYRALGESRDTAQRTLAPYLFALLLGTAVLCGALGASFWVTALSVVLVSTFAGVVNFSREYMMDLPAAAMATLCLAVFAHRGGGILAGVLAGVTLLTKVLAGIFLFGPLVYGLARGDRRKTLLFVAAALATAAVWYLPHLPAVFGYIRFYGFGEGSLPFRSSSHPGYYARILVTQGLGWLPSAALAASFLLAWRRTRPSPLLLVYLVSGYALLTLLPNKGGERYVLALLPPLAVLGALAISRIEAAPLRSSVAVFGVAMGALNYAGLTWKSELSAMTHHHFDVFPHAMPLEESERRGWPTAEVLGTLVTLRPSPSEPAGFIESTKDLDDEEFVDQAYRRFLRRDADDAGRKSYVESLRERSRAELLGEILRSDEFRSRPLRVLVLPDHRVFNASTLNYLAELERLPLRFQHVATGDEPADAALLKRGGPQGPWPQSLPASGVVSAVGSRGVETAAFPCPDGSRIVVLWIRS